MACTVYHVRRVHATFTGRLPDADGRGGASERRLRVANYYGRRRAILLTNNTATIGRVTGALVPCSRHHKWPAACATRRYTDWAEHPRTSALRRLECPGGRVTLVWVSNMSTNEVK